MSENNDPVLPIFVLAVATASAFYVSVAVQVLNASFMTARRRHSNDFKQIFYSWKF